jgi:hypothetical protein
MRYVNRHVMRPGIAAMLFHAWAETAQNLEHFQEKWTPVFRRKCDQA